MTAKPPAYFSPERGREPTWRPSSRPTRFSVASAEHSRIVAYDSATLGDAAASNGSARTLVLALLVVLSAAAVGAQNIGATLQGLITDAQKAVLLGVTVTISGSA